MQTGPEVEQLSLFVLWENVPGAFSSYDAFRAVLEETARVAEPDVSIRPERAMEICWARTGRNFSIAWAFTMPEFFGVAQRRRRIFLVADLAGHSAAEILFEREGLPGYTAAKRRTWEDIAAAAGIRRADAGGLREEPRALTFAANGRDEVRPMYGTATTIHPGLRQGDDFCASMTRAACVWA